VQACGALPDDDDQNMLGGYKERFNYVLIIDLAMRQYGLPASTVKLTPPVLDTCDGAAARMIILSG
jgi:hypothetical protein